MRDKELNAHDILAEILVEWFCQKVRVLEVLEELPIWITHRCRARPVPLSTGSGGARCEGRIRATGSESARRHDTARYCVPWLATYTFAKVG
jgi:hypothetical protein